MTKRTALGLLLLVGIGLGGRTLAARAVDLPLGQEPTVAREDRRAAAAAPSPTLVLLDQWAAEREWDNWKINSDATAQVQNEQQVVVHPLDADNLVAVWRDFRLGYRRVGVGVSVDGGLNWEDSLFPLHTYPLDSDPGLTWDSDGNFYAVILSYTDTSSSNGLFVRKSADGGATWGAPVTAVNGVAGVFEDKELIACDRTGGANDGNLYVAWARFYSTQIYCVRSTNGGASFQTPRLVSDSGGVQWPVPCVGADGTLYIGWVDLSSSSIKLDRSLDGGQTFGTDQVLTSLYTGAVTLNGGIDSYCFPALDCDLSGGAYHGRLHVAYMDRQSGDYNIYYRRSDNEGATWTAPVRLNDDALGNGRDQFHPWLSVAADGSVSVVFYDRRLDPANYLMDLYFTQSTDGGLTWSPNARVSTVSSDPNAGLRAGLIGEYIGLASSSAGRVHPVWTDMREGNQDAYTAVIGGTTAAPPAELASGGLALAAAPNPFLGETRLSFSGARAGALAATIHDAQGRTLRRLTAQADVSGSASLVWDGRDEAGRRLPSGVYLLRAEAGGEAGGLRLLLLR